MQEGEIRYMRNTISVSFFLLESESGLKMTEANRLNNTDLDMSSLTAARYWNNYATK